MSMLKIFISNILKKCLSFLPLGLRNQVRIAKEKLALKNSKMLREQTIISQEEIKSIINNFKFDCDIFLHTSLRRFGYEVEGGKDFVVQYLKDSINLKSNTLLVSALPFRTTMKEFLDNTKILDMRTAPIAMGSINKKFASELEAKRSLHPTHSVVAIGSDAENYTKAHHIDKTPFGINSPYYRLLQKKGKILLFGVDLDSMTFTHVVEDLIGDIYPLNIYLDKVFSVSVTDFQGNLQEVLTMCHDPKLSSIRDCESIRKHLIDSGAMISKKIGKSEISIVDANKYTLEVLKLLKKGISIYGNLSISSSLSNHISNLINQLESVQ